ncbi:hypothetical protein CPB84DRAFT_1848084 [Gymnopilus junonius]|uniref:Uncharacterized protein n=1 Tax=Gymnopilus junonius TaxID=109634 RepID=A0A9P5TL70_GYMJU|nr:hypothetical protein CPB84DRAFT_1848084 [Gymnopilus junonius]
MTRESRNTNNIQHIHLQQSVTITGFGDCNDFMDAYWHFNDVVYQLDDHFSEVLVMNKTRLWEGQPTLSFFAWYFTLHKDTPTEWGLDFGLGVDPDGVLRGLLGHNMVHMADNKISFNLYVRYIPIEPSTFKLGNIMEVGFAFYCAPAKGRKVMFAPHLCSLTLLNDSIRKAARSPKRETKTFTLKRMAWEMLDGEAEEVERMQKMTIC